ncbi:MAG: hypothetical protein ABR588_07800, partial [Sphingomicrobium sp.]
MFKTFLLASAATALIAAPASAHDYRWDYHRYHHRGSGDVVAGVLLGAVAGAALAGSAHRYDYDYGYSYPSYGYPAYG